jgi:hypothetical protein
MMKSLCENASGRWRKWGFSSTEAQRTFGYVSIPRVKPEDMLRLAQEIGICSKASCVMRQALSSWGLETPYET